ncbi:Ser/Thr protein phosphatase, putative [Trichomonas vaginalis G3]|uniref:Serine/threonine-protein phosphatase n=1 Tax=Trichomonas vaginalis (strain ATCC PRA-98 / G3) TaxID=412133 RepID=A2FXD1_TRIV3|nr:phosphoprotein phosphatase protein [Trichomonas vaginalis G3]EAX90436.1 Ser/Thr protein phosphatase, putative [Trichomonas vaginalis G3]KAI5554200.1 phosphoprotein phosphatase protein [Trichomonas vaginalis G3]|eukprot:XP_001303366.1 Ser/Thr protein phosphatase [Trichomonas vaginalis G3]
MIRNIQTLSLMLSQCIIEAFKNINIESCLKDIQVPQLKTYDLLQLLKMVKNVFQSEPTLLNLEGNFNVIGDLHGNLRDLLRILKFSQSNLNNSRFIFLGDLVDRGDFSVEILILLFSLKLAYPTQIYLLRGNHEFIQVNAEYGFRSQVLSQYNEYIFQLFNDIFSYFPLAAVVNNSYFLVHGGIGPNVENLSQIQSIPKPIISFQSNPIITALVWSDPCENINWFGDNSRGKGYFFGIDAVRQFLEIIRSHECANGSKLQLGSNVVTVFSTSYYIVNPINSCGIVEITSPCNYVTHLLEPKLSIKKQDVTCVPFDINSNGDVIKRKIVLKSSKSHSEFKKISCAVKLQKLKNVIVRKD